jgi:hypothetical protein
MGSNTISDVARRWVDVTEGAAEKHLWNPRIPVYDGRLYAFDRNFELVRAIKNKSGKVTHYILNGDELRVPFNFGGGGWGWGGGGTTTHQAWVRNHLVGRKQVIIPFTALEESGVEIDSIKIIDVLPDRNEEIHHRTKEFPSGAIWHNEPIMQSFELTREERAAWLKKFPWYDGRHGGRKYTVDDFPEWAKFEQRKVGTKQVLRTNRRTWSPEITVTNTDEGTVYEWETHHHWLGESLIYAKVTWKTEDGKEHHRWAYFLSGFDHQEPMPLYFFAEMPPRVKPTTVAEAYEFLKPEPVLLAEQMGRKISRQGDIFAIAAPSFDRRTLRKMGAAFEKRSEMRERGQEPRAMLLGTNHRATEVARMPNGSTLARGQLYHDPIGREKDHVARKLGDGQTWHLIIKNTVPDSVVRR